MRLQKTLSLILSITNFYSNYSSILNNISRKTYRLKKTHILLIINLKTIF